jgi:hypothetical protein
LRCLLVNKVSFGGGCARAKNGPLFAPPYGGKPIQIFGECRAVSRQMAEYFKRGTPKSGQILNSPLLSQNTLKHLSIS